MPKSVPKGEHDQYIRKRMIVAGSSYCQTSTLKKVTVGSHLDLAAEPDNPHDKDAVMLLFENEKIGYVPKTDRAAFVTCLRLKRKMYGIITDIDTTVSPAKYEFEVWFDRQR